MRWISILLCCFLLVIEISPSAINKSERLSFEDALYRHIDKRAKHYGFETDFIHRIIWEESQWKFDAISPEQAFGIMQLLLPTAWEIMSDSSINKHDLLENPFMNVEAGMRYLAWLREEFRGDMKLAVAAYNRGIGQVRTDILAGRNPINAYTRRITERAS